MAALGVEEGRRVLELVDNMRAQGISIFVISHSLYGLKFKCLKPVPCTAKVQSNIIRLFIMLTHETVPPGSKSL